MIRLFELVFFSFFFLFFLFYFFYVFVFFFFFNDTATTEIYTLSLHDALPIYINIDYPEFNNCEEIREEQLCFEFFEEATLNVDSIKMVYQWDFGDGTTEQKLEVYHCYKEPGFYIVNLNIMDPVIDKTFVNQASYELELEAVNQPKINFLDSIPINKYFFVNVEQGKWKDFKIDNFYIDFGDSTIVKNDSSPHQYKSAGIKKLKVLVTGYNPDLDQITSNCFYKSIKVTKSNQSYIQPKEKAELLDRKSVV